MLNLARANLSNDPLHIAISACVERACARKHAYDQARGYLGASLIGDECLRKIQFEWMVQTTSFPARVHSIFMRGHFFEAETRQMLIDAGFVFAPPEVLGFVAADGLIAGHADGIIIIAPAVPGLYLPTPALWEHKALNAKNFNAVKRDCLAKVFPRYAAQVALYQNFLDVADNPALVTVTNADTCERLYFTVPFDAQRAQEASDRAVQVIEATRVGELLPRLDPACEDFRCKMCSRRERCLRYE
jgi:hypothetical protein